MKVGYFSMPVRINYCFVMVCDQGIKKDAVKFDSSICIFKWSLVETALTFLTQQIEKI